MKRENVHRGKRENVQRPSLNAGSWTLNIERFLLLLLLASAGVACAEDLRIAAARRALDESLPEIAISKLTSSLAGAGLMPDERDAATQLLAEAQLANGVASEALATIEPLARRGLPSARLLRAHALLASQRWQNALSIYQQLTALPDAPLAARLGEAECLQTLDRGAEAIRVLEAAARLAPENATVQLRLAGLLAETQKAKRAREILARVKPLRSTEEKWKLYIEGRLLLSEGQAEQARGVFEKLLREPEGLTPGMLAGAAMGASDARAALQGFDSADRPLETFLWNHPESPFVATVFSKLDQVYAQQQNPGEDQLIKMAAKQPQPSAALARFYAARMQVRKLKPDRAAVSLDLFVNARGLDGEHPLPNLLPYAHLMQADLRIAAGDFEEAVRALEAAERSAQTDDQRGEIQLRTGRVLYQQGQYLLAANEFDRAGARSPRLRESAAFNAALASLAQKNFERFEAEYRELNENFPRSPLRADLSAEEGLAQARSDEPKARDTLELFLRHFPTSPRRGDARLALAELAYGAGDNNAAARYLKAAGESSVDSATSEHAAYLAVFLAESQSPGDARKTIQAALEFIRKFPKSPLLSDVRMKLGQVYFRASDFPSAETQFATLAKDDPASPYAEAALFLAGQAAMQWIDPGAVDRALKLFDEVVKRDGPLKLHARQHQAIVQSKLGKESEAVTLYDAILSATPPAEPELRYAALAGKGDNLLILGRKNPAQLDAAIGVFDQLAALPDVPAAWRNEALYKKARALRQLKRNAEALTTYHSVLEGGGPETREFFWFYKAGFDAADIFQSQEPPDWKGAIAIYEKMARLEGPRAAESREQARQLRLKHFIWE
jgi:tetratricopeptide (TPR) repeat protein